ncbi:hypothetical protein HOD29_02820 [archaeon]|jgi:hypothetical protein|nr:hypothetical protein [archaeon]
MNNKITEQQLKALKYLIIESKDGSNFAKQVAFFLINASENLTKPVCISLIAKDNELELGKEVKKTAHGFHDFVSGNGTTHLSEIMVAMGTEFDFWNHSGYRKFIPETQGIGYTFWLSKERYDHHAELLEVSIEELKKIELKSGLYSG